MGSSNSKSKHDASKSRQSTAIRITGRVFAGLFAVFGLIVSGIWWLTATDDGLNTLAGWAEAPIGEAVGGTIRIDGLSGSLWERLEGRAVTLKGTDGFALNVVDFRIDWTPGDLLDGVLRLSDIGARKVALTIPSTADTEAGSEESAESGPPALSLPQLPFAIVAERVDLPVIDIETEPGVRFTLSVAGKADADETGSARTTVDIDVRQDGATFDTASIRAGVSGQGDPTLSVHAAATFPADGLVMRLIDPPEAFRRETHIQMDGAGPAEAWTGMLSIESANLFRLEGQTRLSDILSNVPGLGFDGRIDLQDAASLELPAELEGNTTIGFDALLADGHILSLDRFRLGRPDLASIDARGTIDLDTLRINADGAVGVSPGAAPFAARLSGADVNFSAAEGTFTFDGTPDAPKIDLWLQASELETADLAFGHIALSASASTESSGAYQITATGRAERSRWPDQRIDEAVGATLGLDLSALIAPGFERVSDLDLSLAPAGVRIRGDFDLLPDGIASPSLRIDAARLRTFQPFVEQPLDGSATIRLTQATVREDGGLSTDFDIRLDELTLIDAETTEYLGRTPGARGNLRLSANGNLAVTLVELETATGTLGGTIRLQENFAHLAAKLDGTVKLGALPVPPDIDIAESELSFAASLEGPLDRPDISLDTAPINLRTQGYALNRTRLGAVVQWSGTGPVATIDAGSELNGTPIALTGRVTAAADYLELEAFSLEMSGATVSGEARLDGYTLPADGTLDFRIADLSALAALVSLPPLSGRANGTIRLEQGRDGNKQAGTFDASLDELTLSAEEEEARPVTLSSARLTGRIGDALTLTAIRAEMSAIEFSAGPARIASLDARFDGDTAQARLGISLEGTIADLPKSGDSQPMRLSFDAMGEGLDSDDISLTIDRLDGMLGTIDIGLRTPAHVTLREGGIRSLSAEATVSEGAFSINYAREDTAARFKAHLSDLPLSSILAFNDIEGIAARLDADLEISETTDRPTMGKLRADLTKIAFQDTDTPEDLGISLQGDLTDGRFSARLEGMGTGLEDTHIDLSAPIALSLIGRSFRLDHDAPLSGSARVSANLGKLWPYVPAPEHAVQGRMDVDLDVAGSIAEPAITGSATLSDGIYEHLEYGTLLRNFAGKWGFDQEAIVIERLAANDPEGGELTMRGRARLTAPLTSAEADIRFDNLQLVHTDAIKLRADAEMTVGRSERSDEEEPGKAVANRLAGTVTLRRGEVNLAVALPPSTPTLDVREEGAPPPPESDGNGGSLIALDLDIRIPGQLFVRGRGIDSEWEGALSVKGTSDKPVVAGILTTRRGRFDVIGKSFSLEESTIRFSGGDTIDPILGIRGVYEADDLEVIARLTGPASKPEIVLESQPPLPRDEILSRVLFGKSKGRLSAVEAAQLAASANELSGGGGGFDVLGSIRQFVGVDVLQVDAGDDGPEVRTGKYVAEGVYVGAKQGTSPGSTSVEVEVELLPNVSVNSETGQTDSTLGIQFKWDY